MSMQKHKMIQSDQGIHMCMHVSASDFHSRKLCMRSYLYMRLQPRQIEPKSKVPLFYNVKVILALANPGHVTVLNLEYLLKHEL